jgi:ubiquinone/menaquinone biosynthesis C-methylase UbiE
MEKPVTDTPPSPQLFLDVVSAFQRTAALKGAIDLDLFTALGGGARGVEEIADRCRASRRGIRILLDYMVILGFVRKEKDEYTLTRDSAAFLDRRSPTCLAGMIDFRLSPTILESFRDVAAAVRKGGTVAPSEGSLAPSHAMWLDFAKAMAPMVVPMAEKIAEFLDAGSKRKMKVLDIAAGHGLYGITVAKQNPNAEVVAVDWPNVLEVAKENAEKAGVGKRHRGLPGSAFDVKLGDGYDAVLLTNFLHHFDAPTCEKLLKKIHAALAPGGRVATVEFVPNDDRVTPPESAGFALTMLVNTPAGEAYTFKELERMFKSAGFSASELHRLPPQVNAVVISKK